MVWELPIGARFDTTGTHFRVWAPRARTVEVVLFERGEADQRAALARGDDGYFAGHIAGVEPGARYLYSVDGGEPRPDPASRFQPEGVHGPSEVVDPASYSWHDIGWLGRPMEELVIYELHVGTVTPEGSFDSLIGRLDAIRALGATAIELMPVAAFPGERGWGYDGVGLFAPHVAYGGPESLRRLVDAAHAHGLAVILDVVYNHLGPDGNYLTVFSPAYFTERHHTPWGAAINVDGPDSRPVRDFFIANALYWAHEYHIDGLRLDATHAILDDSPLHLIAELAATARRSMGERRFVLIAENEENDPQIVTPLAAADQPDTPEPVLAWGLDGVWADDFNHELRVALTGEQDGYYGNYGGSSAEIAATMRQNWFYQGQISPDRGRPRGAPADHVEPHRFVYCIQNHDQVGNRATGDRLSDVVSLDAYRAASALLLLAPQTPLIWMGQEWAAGTPFLYFTDHNPELGRLVTEGRRKEFAYFTAFAGEAVPDPQAKETFLRSKLDWAEREREPHAGVLRLYADLLALRREHPALAYRGRDGYDAQPAGEKALMLRRRAPEGPSLHIVVNLGGAARLGLPSAGLRPILDSEHERYGGRGAAHVDGEELVFTGPGAVALAVG